MPVPNLSVLINLQKDAEESVSSVGKGKPKSPSQMSKRRSPRNGNQLKITSMFAYKRNRSPEGKEITQPKKLKYDEEGKENSIDSLTTSNYSSDNLEIAAENGNVDVEVTKVKAIVMKDVEVNNVEANVTKNEEELSSFSENLEENAIKHNITEIDHNIDDGIQNQKQNGPKEKQKENGITENNNEVVSYKTPIPDNEKCNICGQLLNNSDIIYYQGHPQDAVEEYIALTNEKLVLASEKIRSIMGSSLR